MNEFGLYIHIPFCNQKCHYCDFNSVPWNDKQGAKFFSGVKKEIELTAAEYSVEIKTIFFGGGTPTILTGSQLKELLDYCREIFTINSNPEVTMEANPETVTEDKLKLIKEAGVDRLSFGVQSLNNFFLNKLGRRHTVKKAVNSYYLARRLGFSNLNLDLIFALPGQTISDWKTTVRQACQLEPEHLSCYNLKLESGTKMYNWAQNGKLDLPSEEKDLKMYKLTKKMLSEAGYHQYEISNFARPGFESEHNKIYWQNKPYLGIGPGAHFYDGRGRGANFSNLAEYFSALEQGRLPTAEYNKLTKAEKIEETMMLGLRLTDGISLSEFKNRYGSSVYDIYQTQIEDLKRQGLIKIKDGRIFLTEAGLLLANRVLTKFLLN